MTSARFLHRTLRPPATQHAQPLFHFACAIAPIVRSPEMPRYFFHLPNSGARDDEGQDLPDDAVARQEAIDVARELSREQFVSGGDRLVVTNAAGKVIHEEILLKS
jgi:uncharacterized protein DUF6894